MRSILIFFCTAVMLVACGQSNQAEFASNTADMASMENDEGDYQASSQKSSADHSGLEPKVIKNAEYRIKVDNVKASTERIEALAKSFGGYVSEMNLTNSSYEINNNILIRVPQENFDSLMNRIAGEARFTDYRRVHTQDVTAEFIDVETRLKTKREVRDRYIDILRNQAKTVEDVLKTEEQLRLLQEEIEAAEGRLKYLNSQVSLSTINVNVYEELPYRATAEYSFGEKVVRSLKNGWTLIQSLFLGLIAIWPLLLIGALVFWQRKRIFRFRKKG